MVRKLSAVQFRNLSRFEIQFSDQVNLFVGENGQGKTNFLEALHLLFTGESFRYAENINFIQNGADRALLKTIAVRNGLEYEVSLEIQKSKKIHLLQGKRVTIPEIRRLFPIVLFSPESLSAIKEGADVRRQLLDEAFILDQPSEAHLLYDFRKALRTRNRILKDHVEGIQNEITTTGLLESLNPIFLDLGARVAHHRIEVLRRLSPLVNEILTQLFKESDPQFEVQYLVSSENCSKSSLAEVRENLKNRAAQLFRAELASGTSLVGPQKHDVRFLYHQNDSRFYCSQGQQRGLILAFKMAQIVYDKKAQKTAPILLLDDVLSELDHGKREALSEFLAAMVNASQSDPQKPKTQIFMTSTDFDETGVQGLLKKSEQSQKNHRLLDVENGTVRERVIE